MTDLPPEEPAVPSASEPVEQPAPVEFTKTPQPDLPLAERRRKAGITRNRVGLWIIGAAFAAYLIITGIVGFITKAHP